MKKVLVAMSGGVDSSVAAYLVRESGHEVTGVTMRLFDNRTLGVAGEKKCCSIESIKDAHSVADTLGIQYMVYDFRAEFEREVIDRFVAAYENGMTPNPCIDCNRFLKFDHMFECGKRVGHDHIATGHYARIEHDASSGRWFLKKAVDLSKDQSYVLYSLTQDQLAATMFPLGEMTKRDTREIASSLGLITADKSESQDICFVPDGDYASFIRQHTGRDYPPGDFVDRNGNILGEHKGIIKYTIGQRKGLGLALKKPMYVCELDTTANRVVLGDDSDLFTRELEAVDFNWIAMDVPSSDIRAKARIRYKHKEAPATVIPTGEDSVKVIFDEPQRAITSGQSVVLYDGDYVIGGGTII